MSDTKRLATRASLPKGSSVVTGHHASQLLAGALRRFVRAVHRPLPSRAQRQHTLYGRLVVFASANRSRASLHGGGFVYLGSFAGFGSQSVGVCHPAYRFGPNPALNTDAAR